MAVESLSQWELDRYTRITAGLKDLGRADRKVLRAELKDAFKRVYRAIAFDIDGTLTYPQGDVGKDAVIPIEREMAVEVANLLVRGLQVILITGRGASALRAAKQIKDAAKLSSWQLRRLYCITNNGTTLYSTPWSDAHAFLEEKSFLAEWGENDKMQFESDLRRELASRNDVSIDVKEHSIRIVVASQKLQKTVLDTVSNLAVSHQDSKPLHVSAGKYAESRWSVDISPTNKHLALGHFANTQGIDRLGILRIGDQGGEGGNDYDLLKTSSGFSVDVISNDSRGCFPVLELARNRAHQLKGVDACRWILRKVRLIPDLVFKPRDHKEYLTRIRAFERAAIQRSRQETQDVSQRIKLRLKSLLGETAAQEVAAQMTIGDIFDLKSGAVKFADWELSELQEELPLGVRGVFDWVDMHELAYAKGRIMRRCMYSDSSLLLRGPLYYQHFLALEAFSDDHSHAYSRNVGEWLGFVDASIVYLQRMREREPTLMRFKLLLGILDNVRCLAINLLLAAHLHARIRHTNNDDLQEHLYEHLLFPHTEFYYTLLLDQDRDWTSFVTDYTKFLNGIGKTVTHARVSQLIRRADQRINRAVTVAASRKKKERFTEVFKEYFRWREADFFLQSLAALQLALHEFTQRSDRKVDIFVGVGIAHGGIELPALACTLAKRRQLSVIPALTYMSHYGDDQIAELMKSKDPAYVRWLLEQKTQLFYLSTLKANVGTVQYILLDDNSTTGITLQLTRDWLAMNGLDTVGAVIVKFPGSNRFKHMTLEGHSGLHPDVLFNFVRGLIAPSPFTRIRGQKKNSNGEVRSNKQLFLDELGHFDKAKERIARLLTKNGNIVKVANRPKN